MEFTILIVEDSLSLLRLYSTLLLQAGYNVLQVTNGEEALATIKQARPEVVILDRVLPDMDGSDICHVIKTTPESASTYVIMLSAFMTSEDDRVSGLEAGADDYIVKPVGKRELLARVAVGCRLRRAQMALEASEAQFRTLAENSPDIITRLDRERRFLYVNPTVETYFPVNREDLLERDILEVGVPDDLIEEWRSTFDRVLSNGRAESLQIALDTRTGERVLDARMVPEFDTDGNVTSILTVTRDFTERIEAEQEISRLAAVVQQTGAAVLITDPTGIVVYCNATYSAMTGFSTNQTVGHRISAPADHTGHHVAQHLARVRERNEHWDGVTAMACRDGTICEVEATIFPVLERNTAAVINYALILRDLTERRRAEQEREILLSLASDLRQARGREQMIAAVLKRVLSMVPIGGAAISTTEPHTGALRMELAVGSLAPLTGRAFADVDDNMQKAWSAGRAYRTAALPSQFGQAVGQRIVATAGIPLLAEHREIGVLWASFKTGTTQQLMDLLHAIADRTASALRRVDLLEEIQRYAADLERRVAERTVELERANEQLRELDKLKSKFVSNVTHELRTPISALKLYVNLIKAGKPEKREQYEDMLQLSADRLGQLVEDILNLSRLEIAHHRPPDFEPTDLSSVAKQVIALHQPAADAAGVRLLYRQDTKVPLVLGDYNQLSQLVNNLVVNAINYTVEGEITVTVEFRGNGTNRVSLIVEDFGMGILPEDLPHIFERFYRGSHRHPTEIPGTGLGLAIVHEIVAIHGGEIAVYSEEDRGTKFIVWLPAESTSVPVQAEKQTTY